MKKSEIVDILVDEFIKDKEIIKKNLVTALETIALSKQIGEYKGTLIFKLEKVEKNEDNK